MTFTFDVETWFKDSVHLFPTSTIVYNIRKILIYYSKQRCDMTFIVYLKRVFTITAYTLPKGMFAKYMYQVCARLEMIYGLGKDFTISIDLSISQTQNCGSRSMHTLRSISRVWTMSENICSGQIIIIISDGLTDRLITTKLLDSELTIYSLCFKSYICCI